MEHPPENLDATCFNWQALILKTTLPSNAKYLALYLGTFMNSRHNVAWPSQKTIQKETGLAHATILKWLNFLADEGWIHKESGDFNRSNRYTITIPERVGQPLTYVSERPTVGQPLTSNNNIITKDSKETAHEVVMAEGINLIAWDKWVQHRKEIRKKLTPLSVKQQQEMLKKHPMDVQDQIIDLAIRNGWQGLFDKDFLPRPGTSSPAGRSRDTTLQQDLADTSWAD